ncbi:MAG: archaellin/type IV pilin N-terminal domain-containing protein [Candidatus Aenigmatarchaeota archaeon]
MRKGISPLIAAVILLAFTIAVAGIGSQFFIGFSERQSKQAGQKGENLAKCSNINLDILSSEISVNTPDNVTLIVENDGGSTIRGLTVTTFNETAVVNDDEIEPSSIASASAERLIVNETVSGGLYKIEVSSTECPTRSTIVEKNEYGEWQTVV